MYLIDVYWHAHRSKQSQEWREWREHGRLSAARRDRSEMRQKWSDVDAPGQSCSSVADNKDIQANQNTHWSTRTFNSDSDSWWGWGADVSPSQRPFNEDRQCCLQLSRGRRGKRGGGGRAARDRRPFQLTVPPSEGLANRWSIHEWNLPHTWVNLIFPSKPWASRGHLTSEVG